MVIYTLRDTSALQKREYLISLATYHNLFYDSMKYYGIADAHGIESFLEKNDSDECKNNISMLVLRASLNRQRHAIFYVVEFEDELSVAIVKKYLEKGYEATKEMVVIQAKLDNENGKKKVKFYEKQMLELAETSKAAWIRSLEVLKHYATSIAFPKEVKDEYMNSWQLIPNPKLDPWRSEGWDTSKQNVGKGTSEVGNDLAIGG